VGRLALETNLTGSDNTAIGFGAGGDIDGSDNIDIGSGTSGLSGESGVTRIGDGALSGYTACYISGIVGNGPFACDVSIDPVTGQLGVGACVSERFKKDIDSIDKASEAIYSLKPMTFHYKNDKANTPQFGLIAEEVAKVNPALIAADKEGKPYSVRYQQINAMLLNEFLKEHRKVQDQERKIQEQQTVIAQLKKEMETVVARLKEHDLKIQRVSDQVEMNKAAPQLVASDQ